MEQNFVWEREPEAEKLVLQVLQLACMRCPFLNELAEALLHSCSAELIAFVDHISLPEDTWKERVENVGYIKETPEGFYRHRGASLPNIALKGSEIEVALAVDAITDFLQVRGLFRQIEGQPFSGYRRATVHCEDGIMVSAVERRGDLTLVPCETSDLNAYFFCKELWMTRDRSLVDEEANLDLAIAIATKIVEKLGVNPAASLVLECERKYWQAKNTAAQLQKNRQDRLGMGWANHDHHTFRSSRKHFYKLVRLFETLGFHCRERFYAGKQAGWGAQVMENSISKLVLFLDVDLDKEELEIDFAHERLPEKKELGTIGLWCALHGDSILHAGMHHLEAQFAHDKLTEDLRHLGIRMMDPFSQFPYLKQAFTQGEIWRVNAKRLDALKQQGLITREQAEQFALHGAIGSHLENLQRKEGYKGFNQENVSTIIKKTDPRANINLV